MISVVRTKYIWFTLSGLLFAASLVSIAIFGFKLGIDFTGGTLQEIIINGKLPSVEIVNDVVAPLLNEKPHIQPAGEKGFIIRMKFIDEATHQKILEAERAIPEIGDFKEERLETIGPTVSAELKSKAVWSIFAVMAAIIIYIAFAFRKVSQPLQSWKFGVVAVVALLHDVIIPAGIFSVLGRVLGYEVDTLFVTAVLTILGFSVHDTIVTFDRIREHLIRTPKAEFSELVDQSVRETFRRSINTSMTVLLVLLPVYFFGGVSITQFTLVLILGVIFGTYSSICIAAPLLVVWNNLARKN